MNKMMRLSLMAATVVSFSLPTWNFAEAANVALLPLINNVAERDDLGSIYYDRAVEAVKKADADLVDDNALDKAIAKYTKMGILPDRTALEGIASEGNVDIVIAMQVDVVNRKDITLDNNSEYDLITEVAGQAVYYDATKGICKTTKISDTEKMPGMLGARFDVEGELFANNVTRFVKRALGVKKVSFEKPRISKSGQRGNRK